MSPCALWYSSIRCRLAWLSAGLLAFTLLCSASLAFGQGKSAAVSPSEVRRGSTPASASNDAAALPSSTKSSVPGSSVSVAPSAAAVPGSATPSAGAPMGTDAIKPPAPNAAGEEEDGPGLTAEQIRQRDAWFYGIRAYPNAHTQPGVRGRAVEHLQQMRLQQRAQLAQVQAKSKSSAGARALVGVSTNAPISTAEIWQQIGPEPSLGIAGFSGRINSIAVDPQHSGTVYLGVSGGGIWKTTDSGANWAALTDQQASLATGAVAVDPTNANTVYVGTGEANQSVDSYHGVGVLKSTDAGNSWTIASDNFQSNGFGNVFGSLAVSPANGSLLLAGHGSGIYRSTNGGQTWTHVLVGTTSYAVFFDKQNPTTAYAALGGIFGDPANGVYKSTDSGVTWKSIMGSGTTALPTKNLGRINLVEDPNQSGVLYVSISNCCAPFSGVIGIFKSADGGLSWTQLTPPPDCCDWYRNLIAVSPKNSNTLFVGGFGLYRSQDGGQTWAAMAGTHPDMHAMTFSGDGSTLYLGNDGGVFSSTDFETPNPTFTNLNTGIATINFYPGLALDPNNADHRIAGTQDDGLLQFAGDAPWSVADYFYCGDGGSAAIDAANPNYALATCEGGSATLIRNSTGGTNPFSWIAATTGINLAEPHGWFAPVAFDTTSELAYYGTNHIYQSLDKGASWTAISGQLSPKSVISSIVPAPSSSDTVYAASYDAGLWVTTNATAGAAAVWTSITAGLPNAGFSSIAVSPTNTKNVWLSVLGTGVGHVYHSTNGGTSWTNVTGNLPDISTSRVILDPDLVNTLYVATDVGVFATGDGGATWSAYGDGLPNVVVQDVQLFESGRSLVAVTHGRSSWTLALPNAQPNFSNSGLDFGTALVNTTTVALTITVSNNTAKSFVLGVPVVSAGFAATTTCGSSIASGASCNVNVTFAPTAVGTTTGTLTVSAGQISLSASLTGSAVSNPLTVSGNSLNYADDPVGAASAVQSVTVTNLLSSATSIGSISITGDFSQTNTCGSSLAANSTCKVSVMFDPSTTGTRSGTVSIPNGGVTLMIALTGSGVSFQVAATGTISVAVNAGSSASYTLSITPVGNSFPAAVALSCSAGLPSQTSCSFTPNSPTPGSSAVSVALAIRTAGSSAALMPLPGGHTDGILFAMMFPVALLLVRRRMRGWIRVGVLCLAAALLLFSMACGGGTTVTPNPPTPSGSYPITVTAKSGTISQTTMVTLKVN